MTFLFSFPSCSFAMTYNFIVNTWREVVKLATGVYKINHKEA
jgi:hypothetical protein